MGTGGGATSSSCTEGLLKVEGGDGWVVGDESDSSGEGVSLMSGGAASCRIRSYIDSKLSLPELFSWSGGSSLDESSSETPPKILFRVSVGDASGGRVGREEELFGPRGETRAPSSPIGEVGDGDRFTGGTAGVNTGDRLDNSADIVLCLVA